MFPSLRFLGAVAAAAAVSVGLAACGGGSDDGSDAAAAKAKAQDAMLKFARCMREHGVQMDDPKPGGGVMFRSQAGADMSRMEAAQKACEKYMRGAIKQPSKAQQASIKENALKFSKCMRDHGVDFPDPEFDGGKVKIGPGPGSGFNPDDQSVQAAQQACQHFMGPAPKGGPGGPGGKQSARAGDSGKGGGAEIQISPGPGGP
jgi:hypothetical protein